jgi:hypothetical protein
MVYSNFTPLALPIEMHFIACVNYFVSNMSSRYGILKLFYFGFTD